MKRETRWAGKIFPEKRATDGAPILLVLYTDTRVRGITYRLELPR